MRTTEPGSRPRLSVYRVTPANTRTSAPWCHVSPVTGGWGQPHPHRHPPPAHIPHPPSSGCGTDRTRPHLQTQTGCSKKSRVVRDKGYTKGKADLVFVNVQGYEGSLPLTLQPPCKEGIASHAWWTKRPRPGEGLGFSPVDGW